LSEVGVAIAFGAGVVSFASPCVLPVVPAYVSLVSGIAVTGEDHSPRQRVRLAASTLLFVAGFAVVFIALGLTATTVGRALTDNQEILTRVSGVIVLAMAAFVAASMVLRSPRLYQERRFHPRLARYGPFAAPVAGVAFGFGWTPCIGPVLTSILAVAATRQSATQGAVLLGAYAAGLGVPFVVFGLAAGRTATRLGWLKRRGPQVTIASSVLLAGFGVLLVLDRLSWVTSQVQSLLRAVGLDGLSNLG
jgi:cytochrome c-type biogenesis protein